MSTSMSTSVHDRIKILIEETNDAFGICASCGNINADYAEFASLSFPDFKDALCNPALTKRELTHILRRGSVKHKNVNPRSCWATFMAHYVSSNANSNSSSDASRRRRAE